MTKKLLVAVGLALIAMLALGLYSRSLQEEVAGGQKVTILVAGEDIAAGARLAKANLAVRDVPEAYVHQSSIRKGEENQIIGRPVAENSLRFMNQKGHEVVVDLTADDHHGQGLTVTLLQLH